MWSALSGFPHSASQAPSTVSCVPIAHLSAAEDTPLCARTALYLVVHLLVVSCYWGLQVKLLWTVTCKSLYGHVLVLQGGGKYLGRERGDHMVEVCLIFFKERPDFSKVVCHFTSPPAGYGSFSCSTPSPTLGMVSLFNFRHSNACTVASDSLPLVTNDAEHPCAYLLSVHLLWWGVCSFACVTTGVFVFLLSCRSSLFVLDLLPDICFGNIFSLYELFSLLTVSFEEKF